MDIELNDIHFGFEGADDPDGAYAHLLVTELTGEEEMSRPFEYTLELVRRTESLDVDPYYLVGARCTLRIRTQTKPEVRLVHGIIASAEQFGDVADGARYTIKMRSPMTQASLMKKSLVYLDKTLREIIDATLTRTSLGAGLVPSTNAADEPDEALPQSYEPITPTYAWRIADCPRLDDKTAHPYCVQYQESDMDFVSRLLEEEGISYHYEHTAKECILVLSDYDGGRTKLEGGPLAAHLTGREVVRFSTAAAFLPRSVAMVDYNWEKPSLELMALSTSGATQFTTVEYPGRYQDSKETGQLLANAREQQFDTGRQTARGESRCRALGAGMVFELEHAVGKFSGEYLVTQASIRAHQRGNFGEGHGEKHYECTFSCIRRGDMGAEDNPVKESNFRPERKTPRPKIYGSQTAIVTADPSATDAEINVGGPSDLGCVRVRFYWDFDTGRHAKEPTSCWVRVSQFFAGGSHGALWHPRVGNEVVVEFLEGDPDRPIITGRVYNALQVSPQNATQKPTVSEIRSLTSPEDGTFNSILFDDDAGKQEINIHASRDMNTSVVHDSSRTVGNNESISVTGSQSTSAGSVSISSGSTVSISATTEMTETAGAKMTMEAPIINVTGGSNLNASAPWIDVSGGSKIRAGAPIVEVNGPTTMLNSTVTVLSASSSFIGKSPNVVLQGTLTTVEGSTIAINGGSITIKGGPIKIEGATVDVSGGTVNVTGSGNVNIKGATINLNP